VETRVLWLHYNELSAEQPDTTDIFALLGIRFVFCEHNMELRQHHIAVNRFAMTGSFSEDVDFLCTNYGNFKACHNWKFTRFVTL
jgi:hypothetical protein